MPRVTGYAAGGAAWLGLIFEPMPHRSVVVSVAAGLAILFSAIAYRLTAESRQQTRVLRAALGYRRGERPWTWTEHFVHGTVPLSVGLAATSSTLDDADAHMLAVGGIILVWAAAVVLSAVQKRRHERSDRERFGSPDAYRASHGLARRPVGQIR